MTPSAANALPDTPCYLNGEFSTLRGATVSVLGRGFIFGDGAHEVVSASPARSMPNCMPPTAKPNRSH